MKIFILLFALTTAFAQTTLKEIRDNYTLIKDGVYINDIGNVFIHDKEKFYLLKTIADDYEQRQVLLQGKIGHLKGNIKKNNLRYKRVTPTRRVGVELATNIDKLKKLAEEGVLDIEHIATDAGHLGKISKITKNKRVLKELSKDSTSIELIDSLEERIDRDFIRNQMRLDRIEENRQLKAAGCKRKLGVGSKILEGLKKSSAFITTHIAQPFVSATGFISAFFDKKKTGPQQKALFQMVNNNLDEINAYLILNQDLPTEDLLVGVSDLIAALLEKEIKQTYEADLTALTKDIMEVYAKEQQITADYINNHPHFQELKKLSGEITQEQINNFIDVMVNNAASKLDGINFAELSEGEIEKLESEIQQDYEKMSQEVLASLEDNILETDRIEKDGIIAGAATLLVPSITGGIIFSSVGAGFLTGGVILAAGGATTLLAKSCLEKSLNNELDQKELAVCGYITNRTMRHNARSYVKAKAAGFRAGSNYRAWKAKKKAKRKAKKASK